ncbi:hypothetical protein [Pseudokineococcus sp. 1T1Z-3]|uniref:hypothetical protein n=1 Tax=Pseudokineococcus sp. 1T1Z-3 TaxID=3132745 RepID=UPI0030992A5A
MSEETRRAAGGRPVCSARTVVSNAAMAGDSTVHVLPGGHDRFGDAPEDLLDVVLAAVTR